MLFVERLLAAHLKAPTHTAQPQTSSQLPLSNHSVAQSDPFGRKVALNILL